jgi:DNA-binding transcriptional LysR family regulator
MTKVNDIQLRRLDAGLLLVFSAAYETRRLAHVARALGLTPSAISHALSRLRDVFGDQLFVRNQAGVSPTRRAAEIYPAVKRALEALRSALPAQAFDVAKLERTFRIAALDYAIVIMGPALIGTIAKDAPGVRLSFVTMGREESLEAVRQGRLDFSIGVFDNVPDNLIRSELTQDSFVTVMRKGHSAANALTLARYAALDHIIVSGSGDLSGPIDRGLVKLGRSSRVIAAVPQFLASLATILISDTIATVPRKMAERYAQALGLAVVPCPVKLPPFVVSAVHARESGQDPATQWLVGLIKQQFAMAVAKTKTPSAKAKRAQTSA